MFSSLKFLLHLLLLIASLQKAQSAICLLEDVSENAAIVNDDIYCFKVKESSVVGSATCVFNVRNATYIRFYSSSGLLQQYNHLGVLNNGDNSITVSLIQAESYTDLLDTGKPPTSSTLASQLSCQLDQATYSSIYIYVDVDEENTQTPSFVEISYVYYDVPETWPLGINLAIEEFGTPIIAQDTDNVFGNLEKPAADIIFELQGLGSEDFEVSTVKNCTTTWPYTYRALLSPNKTFDYQVTPTYKFMLIARNVDGQRESAVNVTVVLKDFDNLDPAFTSSYYSTSVDETMITMPGTYPLTSNPEINAYDQDTGINQTLTYSINTDCGETTYCNILKTYFGINNITGALSFISNGEWPYQTTSFSFSILASQVDNPDKVGNAEVIATFQQPGK